MKKVILLVIVSIMLLACNLFAPRMPGRNGVYYQPRRGDFQQLMRFTGRPEGDDYLRILDVNDEPSFLLWEPYININLMLLRNIQTRRQYDFDYTTSRNNAIDVSVRDKLPTGYYCFVQGNPIEAPSLLKHWCFSVGMTEQRSQLESDLQKQLGQNLMGVFVVDNNFFVELYPGEIDVLFAMRDFYPIDSRYPVVAVRSEYINPNRFELYRLRPAIGISFSRSGWISNVFPECNAYQAGILPGDKIIMVNEVPVNPDNRREALDALREHLSYDITTNLRISRQAMVLDFSVLADCYVLDEIPFASQIMNDYYAFYPTVPLQQDSFYCFSPNEVHGYCFSILSD